MTDSLQDVSSTSELLDKMVRALGHIASVTGGIDLLVTFDDDDCPDLAFRISVDDVMWSEVTYTDEGLCVENSEALRAKIVEYQAKIRETL